MTCRWFEETFVLSKRVYWGRGSATARWSESWTCQNEYPERKNDTKRFSASIEEGDARSSRTAAENAIDARIRARAQDSNACWKIGTPVFELESKEVGDDNDWP